MFDQSAAPFGNTRRLIHALFDVEGDARRAAQLGRARERPRARTRRENSSRSGVAVICSRSR